MGWSLGGFSQITRCRKNLASDELVEGVQFDETDSFCLDGKKLILQAGTHGEAFAEYRTEHADYSKIVISPDPIGGIYFDVYRKDGHIWQYGALDFETTSRAIAPRQRRNIDGVPEMVAESVTVSWALARILDRSGNAILFYYQPDAGAPATLLPVAIRYTSNSTAPTVAATREVGFSYEPRSDARRGYVSGVATGLTERLRKVTVYGPKPTAGGQTKELLWSYDLSYEQGPVTGRSRLNRVEWCDAAGVCQSPTNVDWQEESLEYVVAGGTGSNTSGSGWRRDTNNQAPALSSWAPLILADVTGDGNDDLVYSGPPFQNDGGYRGLGTGKMKVSDGFGGFGDEIIFTGPGFANVNLWRSRPVDFDNDGRVDMVAAGVFPGGVGFQLVTWDAATQKMSTRGEFFASDTLQKQVLLGDVNGDARLDLFRENDNYLWEVRLNESLQTEEPLFGPATVTHISGTSESSGARVTFTDEDGDGRAELQWLGGVRAHSTWGLDKDGQAEGFLFDFDEHQQNPQARHPLGTGSKWRFIDINGDGLKDVMGPSGSLNAVGRLEARINTGLGYGEAYDVGSVADIRVGSDPNTIPVVDDGIRILDFNGDGLEDVFVFDTATRPTALADYDSPFVLGQTGPPHVLLSNGTHFTRVDLPATGAQRVLEYPLESQEGGWIGSGCGWCSAQVGDVDGNGTQDIVQLVREGGQWKFQVMRRDQRAPADLVRAVRSGAHGIVEAQVVFDVLAADARASAERGEPVVTVGGLTNTPFFQRSERCSPTLSCVTRGVTAVRAYRSRAANGHDSYLWYRYAGAVADTGGRGFLGFDSVVIMDEARSAGTLLEFDNSARVALPSTGYAFPTAGLVKSSTSIAPVDRDASPLEFQVRRNVFDHGVRVLGASYDVHIRRQDTYLGVQQTPFPPFVAEIHRYADSAYDDFGNLTARTIGTEGASTEHTHVMFDNDTDRWLIGLARRREVISSAPSPSGDIVETRTTAFEYDPLNGHLLHVHREPDLAGVSDPELRYARTSFEWERGLITSITQTGDPASAAYWEGDASPRVTKVQYDDEGYPRRIENALGHVEWVAYHPSLLPAGLTSQGIPKLTS